MEWSGEGVEKEKEKEWRRRRSGVEKEWSGEGVEWSGVE